MVGRGFLYIQVKKQIVDTHFGTSKSKTPLFPNPFAHIKPISNRQ